MGKPAKKRRPVGGEESPKGKPRGKPFKPGERTAGRQKGTPNKATIEVKEAARLLVEDESYRKNLQARLKSGECAPAVESMLWHYAYGKPKEMVELTGPNGSPLGGGPQVMLYMPDNGRAIAAPGSATAETKPPEDSKDADIAAGQPPRQAAKDDDPAK
jgi:hypothetical protein